MVYLIQIPNWGRKFPKQVDRFMTLLGSYDRHPANLQSLKSYKHPQHGGFYIYLDMCFMFALAQIWITKDICSNTKDIWLLWELRY